MTFTYKDAGVDIDAGEALVERIKPLAKRTLRPEVVGGIGGFAGLCGIPTRYKDPLLVSGTDGVGTKLKTAFLTGKHDTIGIDLVAMCVNDIAVTGAEPLFFLDYFATGALDVSVGEKVVAGIAEGCRQAGCALLGGETAELPGFYPKGEYDLAGFAVGVVERGEVRDGRALSVGDALVGIASSGLHSNGHSLARKIVLEVLKHEPEDRPPTLGGATVGEVLLEPTKIYVKAMRALTDAGIAWRGAAHITGGGLIDNPPRLLPDGGKFALRLRPSSWTVPAIFKLIQSAGVDETEMRRTFNLGVGMIVALPTSEASRAIDVLRQAGETAMVVGDVIAKTGEDEVVFA